MSELITVANSKTLHWRLLTTVSALALVTVAVTESKAEDSDRPSLWIELGGQFTFVNNPSETWTPANLPPVIDQPVTGILGDRPKIGYDADAKITIQPAVTDWTFSAAVRYGKARRGPKFAHDQAYETHETHLSNKYAPTTYAFTDLHKVEETKHVIVDFSAGKDVGLGLFGTHGKSTVNLGVRIAQFGEKSSGRMTAQVSAPYKYPRSYYYGTKILKATLDASRSFTGIGPSISWSGASPVIGSLDDGLAFDWGVNAALLFGRQKATIHTTTDEKELIGKSKATLPTGGYRYAPIYSQLTHVPHTYFRKRTVVVPNIGAFAGISYRVGGRGKVSLGYRADFFFGAMDGGIDTHKSENVGFHGPFATISLGLGG